MHTSNGQPSAGGSHLITDGPFALVRNPLYIGNFFLSFGVLIMSWAFMPWMIFIFIALFSMQYSAIVSLEENYLIRHDQTVRPSAHRRRRLVSRRAK